MLAIDLQPTLLGLAAMLSAVGGVASTIIARRKARADAEAECVERLKECRAEAEKLAVELHRLKMQADELEEGA